MASVEVFTAGLAPMYADIDGYWLIRHQDDSEHWLYDGRHRVGPGGIWLTLDASTIGAGPPVCPATDDIVAFGWEVVNGVDTEYSRVGGQTLINRCDCCQHCLTPTATQTPIDCTTCPTPLPTSTGTPYTPTPTSTPIPTEAVVEACALDEGPDYLDWRVWYPLYVGQGPGQRALNWFSDAFQCVDEGFCGDPRCARRGRAKRYTVPALTQTPTPTGGWSPTATAMPTAGPSPTATPADCAVPGDCGWCLNNPEVYITERMTELGRGSLASLSYAWRSCSSDDCRRFFIEDFAPGRRIVDPIRVYDCAAAGIDFVATPECPDPCNECYDCGTPLPEGTPEACCPTDITPTPNLTEAAIPCQACPIVSGVPTTSGVCCGTSAPTPVPSPTTSTQYATKCPATAVGPTATRTPGPTRTWTPSCCSTVNEVVLTAVPTIPTPTPPVCAGFADTLEIQFDTAPFCGSRANRYSASLSVTVCCALAPCPPYSPEEVVGTWTAYNIVDAEVGTGDFTGVTDETVWFAETGCVFGTEPGDDRFPVRWVITTSDPDLRLTLLEVTYHCCYSGNCCFGANCPPTATMTPSATPTRTPTPCGAPNC